MSGISTHVLDTSLGLPAAGVWVTLEREAPDDYAAAWVPCASAMTDADGRCRPLLDAEKVVAGQASPDLCDGRLLCFAGAARVLS